MPLVPADKPGQLYLGGAYDQSTGKATGEPVYYPSKDLVTHGVCIGMTGSGKTGLCVSLIEECALSGIPTLIIDPKGDMTNLTLAFPDLDPSSFRPWINAEEATRKGITPDELAAQTANQWKEGLASWGIGPDRMRQLASASPVTVYTPGSTAGRPLNILNSFNPPANVAEHDDETLRDEIAGVVSALLGLLGKTGQSAQSPEHILLATIIEKRWRANEATDLSALLALIQTPPFEKLGALSLDAFFPSKDRNKLVLELNSLIASPSFQTWLSGDSLDIASLLRTPEGKPRTTILYLAHLNDAERMFFVALLLNQTLSWMRAQSGASDLRALLYFDEIFGYLPPHPADPPSKRLLMTILKQGRAFGLGTMLVTQNPVDLDYKALSNCGTWLIGKLQTDQDKARILDGLQGAIGEAGKSMDRRALDGMLSRLGSRVFLLHNVHAGTPTIFTSRWAMCYLAGPITRSQIKLLPGGPRTTAAAESPSPANLSDFISDAADESAASSIAPPVPQGLSVRYLAEGPDVLIPIPFARALVTYKSGRSGEAVTKPILLMIPDAARASVDGWNSSSTLPLETEPAKAPPVGAKYASLPALFSDLPALKQLGSAVDDYLAAHGALEVFENAEAKLKSDPGESREAFDLRVRQALDAAIKEEVAKAEKSLESKKATIEKRLQRERDELQRDQEAVAQRKREANTSLLSNIGGALLGLFGGRSKTAGIKRIGSAVTSATSKHGMVQRAELSVTESEQSIAAMQQELKDLQTTLDNQIDTLRASATEAADRTQVAKLLPAKTNIQVQEFGVLWTNQVLRGD